MGGGGERMGVPQQIFHGYDGCVQHLEKATPVRG